MRYHITFGTLVIMGVIMLFSCSSSSNKHPDLNLQLSPETYTNTPISPLLYSHFIEIGFGYQIAPMQAECFFNRSFESFTPYNGKSKNSFGFLLKDDEYIKDWSGEAWYHSGYEHDSWYAAPGKPDSPSWITNESTHFIKQSPLLDIFLETVDGGCGHGNQSIRIINKESQEWGGIAQDGKWMVNGKTYNFSGFLKTGNKETLLSETFEVEVRLYPEGNWDKPLFTKKITISELYRKYSFSINYQGPTGQITFALFIPPGSTAEADAFSLLPDDNLNLWKAETVETVKKLNPGLIRFPGGCFASFYNWKDGIGDKDSRKPEPSYFWGGLNNNDLGTVEFAMLCKEVGCEMMLCVNIFHPNKEKYLRDSRNPWQDIDYELPQYSDLEEGIEVASDWVAYCNAEKGTHPMADLRTQHGYPEPFKVKYWEMDNETVRWMSAEEYARIIVRYSKAMKAIDPSIKIGIVTYDFTNEVPEMLNIAGQYIDFFADRDDYEDGRLDKMIGWLNEYNSNHSTDIKYCNTEWQVHPYGAQNPKEDVDERFLYGHQTTIKRSMVLGTWYCGLKAAGYLMDWQRRGEIVNFVNYNNFSNTHGQAVIETPKEGAYLTAPGKMYELLSRTPAKWPLKTDNYLPQRTDLIQAQAAYTMNKDSLVLFALNRTDSTKIIEFNLSDLNQNFKSVKYSRLEADDIFARVKIDMPNEVRRSDWNEKCRNSIIAIECTPRSFTQAILSK